MTGEERYLYTLRDTPCITLVRFNHANAEKLAPIETVLALATEPHRFMTEKDIQDCEEFSGSQEEARTFVNRLQDKCTIAYRKELACGDG